MILYSGSWKRTNRPHGCSVSSILGSYNIFYNQDISTLQTTRVNSV